MGPDSIRKVKYWNECLLENLCFETETIRFQYHIPIGYSLVVSLASHPYSCLLNLTAVSCFLHFISDPGKVRPVIIYGDFSLSDKTDRALMHIVVEMNENIRMSLYTPDHLHLLPQESLAGHFPDKNFMVNMNKIQYLFLWVNIGHIFPKDKYTHFFSKTVSFPLNRS